MGIIAIVLFIANHFEALQPEEEIRNSVSTIGIYKEEAETIGNNLIFSYRSPDVYILTKILKCMRRGMRLLVIIRKT